MAVDSRGLYSRFGKAYKKRAIDVQTNILLQYAPKALAKAYESKQFQNHTLNLVDSYMWVVYCNGKKKGHGFLTDSARATRKTVMFNGTPVDGRKEADKFLKKYKSNMTNGWELILVAAAPYSVYLESGTKFHTSFNVISQMFDMVNADMKGKAEIIFDIEF